MAPTRLNSTAWPAACPPPAGGQALREMVPVVRALWQGDYAHDGDIWKFPTSTSVPKPIQQPNPPMWIAARDPDSHNFAVRQRLQRDGHAADEGRRRSPRPEEQIPGRAGQQPGRPAPATDGATSHPRALRSTIPRAGKSAPRRSRVSTAPSMRGSATRQPRSTASWQPSPEEKFAGRPEFELESLHKTAMIGTPEEIIPRIKYYQELGVDEFSFWCDNSLPHAEKKKSLELFIKHVVPAFR